MTTEEEGLTAGEQQVAAIVTTTLEATGKCERMKKIEICSRKYHQDIL